MKRKEATFIIVMEWEEDHRPLMTAQIARDKLLTPLQELWILHVLNKFSIEEITHAETVSVLMRGNEKGKRKSFYDENKKKL